MVERIGHVHSRVVEAERAPARAAQQIVGTSANESGTVLPHTAGLHQLERGARNVNADHAVRTRVGNDETLASRVDNHAAGTAQFVARPRLVE